MDKEITIPQPVVSPFGVEVTRRGVKDVWDAFVVPEQSDNAAPQSVEMRMLMGILRSVYAGMSDE